jgi:tetratricopeptide (TPR) repeat protein/predicted Ser/Thr protein kinase
MRGAPPLAPREGPAVTDPADPDGGRQEHGSDPAPAAAIATLGALEPARIDAQRIRALVASRLFGAAAEPVRIGRFVVLNRLGAGAMGVVYACFDEQLDRKLAVKLLHRRGDPAADARLLREAQALARLSHPNVVQVYEVGSHEGQIWVAMEFVRGTTLRAWRPDAPLEAALEIFVAAGRGLAAAHAAGLVHRDFKPDNVLVGEDDRPRVADFGLARAATPRPGDGAHGDGDAFAARDDRAPPRDSAAGTAEAAVSRAAEASGSGRSTLRDHLTRTGALLGTPAYMAPEQFAGGHVDARSDQFAFCVALWERAAGARPFAGDDVASLAAAVASGQIDERRARPIPPWLRRVLERGLSGDPAARWPSMDALVAELTRDRGARRWRIAAVTAPALLVAALGGWLLLREDPVIAACKDAPSAVAVWGPTHRERIREAFVSTGVAYGSDAVAVVDRELTAWSEAWTALSRSTCEASFRGEISQDLQARRRLCLDRRRDETDSLVALFAEADGFVVRSAVEAVAQLGDVRECEDPRYLDSVEALPPGDRADAIRAAEVTLAKARSRLGAGRLQAALVLADEAVDAAERVDWAPSLGRALVLRGRIHGELLEVGPARDDLERARRIADESADDRTRAEALVRLVRVVGSFGGDLAGAARIGEDAKAAVARLGGAPLLAAILETQLGNVAMAQARYDDAIAHHERALALREPVLGPTHTDIAISRNGIGNALTASGRYADAIATHRAALSSFEAQLGEAHPHVATSLVNLANAILEAGGRGETPEALAAARDAEPLYRRARDIRVRDYGPDHALVSLAEHNLGEALRRQARYEEAIAAFEHATAIKRATYGADSPKIAGSLTGLGQALLALGRLDAAREVLEDARRVQGDKDVPENRAETALALAHALAASDPARAATLAEAAMADYETAGQTYAAEAEVARALLADLGRDASGGGGPGVSSRRTP